MVTSASRNGKAILPVATSIELRRQIEANINALSGNLTSKKLDPFYQLLKVIQESQRSPRKRLEAFKGAATTAALQGAMAEVADDFEQRKQLMDSVAIVLRGVSLDAWNDHHDAKTAAEANELATKYATSADLKQRLADDTASLQRMRAVAGLKSISSAPSLSTVNGFGCSLYGCTDKDATTGSYLSTYCFFFLGIPFFPICRYRVSSNGNSYRFFGKAPLRTFDKWHLAISIGLILLVILFVNLLVGSSTPSRPPTRTTSTPAASTPSYTPRPPSGGGASGRNVYRVPSSITTELNRESAEIESNRATLEAFEAQIEALGDQIERDRLYLDQTSQYAVNQFNAKVDRYNALNQQARIANAAFNQKVDAYNAKLRRYGR